MSFALYVSSRENYQRSEWTERNSLQSSLSTKVAYAFQLACVNPALWTRNMATLQAPNQWQSAALPLKWAISSINFAFTYLLTPISIPNYDLRLNEHSKRKQNIAIKAIWHRFGTYIANRPTGHNKSRKIHVFVFCPHRFNELKPISYNFNLY